MRSFMRPVLGAAALVAAMLGLGLVTPAAAAPPVDQNLTITGLALRGYDPVAYFTEGKPVEGKFNITHLHHGATYRFASAENKKLFVDNPGKFVPQYGGFCAFGVAMGIKVDGDPKIWKIVDGKLYLNLAPPVQKRWESDIPGFMARSEPNWAEIKDADPSTLKPRAN